MSAAAHTPSGLRARLGLFDALVVATGLVPVFVAGTAGAGQVDPSFAAGAPLPVGTGPVSAAVADLNGDGKPDLAAARRQSNDVTVLLGDGAGAFRAAAGSPIAVGRSPGAIAVADFNGDRNVDLVVANAGSRDLTVLLGNGAGIFRATAGSPVKVAGLLTNVTAVDVNRDGNVDLVVPVNDQNTMRSRVTILIGDGSARFAPTPESPLTLLPHTDGSPLLAVADFSGDGREDLAVAFDESTGVSIRLGDGAGGFGAAATVLAGTVPRSFAAADLTGDGRADLAVTSSNSNKVTVLLGNAFRAAAGSPIPLGKYEFPGGIVTADLDGDRKLDLAVGISSGLAVLLGNGAGRFRAAADSPFAAPGEAIAAADFNADGKPDVALANGILFQTSTTPAVIRGRTLPGRPDGVFSTRGLITELVADGRRAAVVTTTKGSCGRVVVWTAPRQKSTTFKPGGCGSILCGTACARNVALGGGEVAWIVESGGNSQESTVIAAKLSGGAAKQIEHAANGNGAGGDPEGGYVGQLLGEGALLAYNSWQVVCSHRDPDYDYCDTWALAAQKLVRVDAGRRVVVKRGAGGCRLAAVGGGRMAVTGTVPWWDAGVWTCSLGAAASAGAVDVLAASGSRLATVAPVNESPPRAIALSKTRLAVLRTFSLDLYDPATGERARSLPLGAAAALQLAGINSKVALLRGPRRLVLARLSDGKLISLPLRPGAATSLVGAKLTEAGLFYAYNTPGATAKGRIVLEPLARLLSRF